MISEWNNTAMYYPQTACMHHLFEEQVLRTPDATAVVCDGRALTYNELNVRANRLASHLQRLGAGPEVPIGIYLEHSVELLVAVLGVLKAGAAYVPLDLRHPKERLALLFRQASISIVVTQGSLQEQVAEQARILVALDLHQALIEKESGANPVSAVAPGNLAYVLYTSGSTGVPKGVLTTHTNLVSAYVGWEEAYRLRTAVKSVCQMASFSFAVFQADWVRALCSGAKLVLCSLETVLTPAKFYHVMVSEGVDFIEFVPAALRSLLRYLDETKQSLSFLSLLVLGSDRWYWHEHAQLRRYCGPHTRLIHSFGLTETTIDSAYFERTDELLAGGQLTPIGRPFPNVQLYIADQHLQPVPIGEVGELYIGGNGVVRGFLSDPVATAQRFIPNPFQAEQGRSEWSRLYATGDLARYLPDGHVVYLGRLDHQVKVRGFRIELGEIETALGRHSGVKEAAVVAHEAQAGNTHLIAYVVAAQPSRSHFAQRPLYRLPNQMAVAVVNPVETHLIYRQIFEEQAYLRHGITVDAGDTIFDVGAHIGLFVLFAHHVCKQQVAVYAFEPAPVTFETLTVNATLQSTNTQLFNWGLSSAMGSASFTFYPKSAGASSFYPDSTVDGAVLQAVLCHQWQRGGLDVAHLMERAPAWIGERLESEPCRCSTATLSHVMREHEVNRIDLLKITAQRSEWDILAGIDDEDWPKIRQLVVEVYDIDDRLAQITRLLGRHGYEVVVDQSTLFARTQVHLVYARRPTEQREESERQPLLLTRPRVTAGELRNFLLESLPDYMVPSQFVFLPALPLTVSGKVDRLALSRQSAGQPDRDQPFVPPRNDTETVLAQIWAAVLGAERVGIHDDFFMLGGHSLLSNQVMTQIRERLEVELPLRTLFELPTVAGMAAMVERKRTGSVEKPAQHLTLKEIAELSDEDVLRLIEAEQEASGDKG